MDDAIKEQLAEKMLPEATLWSMLQAAERQGRQDLVDFYVGELMSVLLEKKKIMQERMGALMPPMPPGMDGPLPGMMPPGGPPLPGGPPMPMGPPPPPGGPPGLPPQVMPEAMMGVPRQCQHHRPALWFPRELLGPAHKEARNGK